MAKCPRCKEKDYKCIGWELNKKACDRCRLDHREHCVDGTWVSDKRTSKSSPKKASELFIVDEEAKEGEEPSMMTLTRKLKTVTRKKRKNSLFNKNVKGIHQIIQF